MVTKHVLAIGTPVSVGPETDPIPAKITAISLRGKEDRLHACYEVDFWDGRKRMTEWFHESDIRVRPDDCKFMSIGFCLDVSSKV